LLNELRRRAFAILLSREERFELFSDDVTAAVESSDPDHIAELAAMLGGIAEAMSARAADRDSVARDLAERVARYRAGGRPPNASDS